MGQPLDQARVFPDVEALLVPWLVDQVGVRVLTDLPADLDHQVPLVQIARIGGSDVRPGLDQVVLDVDAFGANRADAVFYAEQVRAAVRHELPGLQFNLDVGAVVATRCDTVEAPAYRPWDNLALRRFGATYRILFHRVAV